MERFITAPLDVLGDAVERRGYLAFYNPGVRPDACDPHLSYVSLDIETDGIDTLRADFWRFAPFELGFVAERLLGRGKLIEESAGNIEAIRRVFREHRPALAACNLEDCRLVEAIFEKAS